MTLSLHGYVLRELLKNFALTLAALTVLLTMGGGIYNVVRQQGFAAGDIGALLPLLVPISLTLAMPVAALFAATMVYGRLAADNELTACRAAGINVHWLFLSALLLSLFVTAFGVLFGNYVIPEFSARMTKMVRANVREWAYTQLQVKGHLRHGERYFLTADGVEPVEERELVRQKFPVGDGYSYIYVHWPTLLQLDRGQIVRYTGAEWGLCQFDTTSPGGVRITLWAGKARDYEVGKRAVEIESQKIGSYFWRLQLPDRLSLQKIETLLLWRSEPWHVSRVKEEFAGFIEHLMRYRFAKFCTDAIAAGRTLELFDDVGFRYEIRAASASMRDKGPSLKDVEVLQHRSSGLPTRYVAPRVDLMARSNTEGRVAVELRLSSDGGKPAQEFTPSAGQYQSPREYTTLSLDNLALPESLVTDLASVTPEMVFGEPTLTAPLTTDLEDRRESLLRTADQQVRRINAHLSFRLGFAASSLVTIMMGAVLGVIFRGSRVLSAFVLALIPFASITVLMVMGRQLAENQGTEQIGQGVIWGGLIVVGLLDALLIRLGVAR